MYSGEGKKREMDPRLMNENIANMFYHSIQRKKSTRGPSFNFQVIYLRSFDLFELAILHRLTFVGE